MLESNKIKEKWILLKSKLSTKLSFWVKLSKSQKISFISLLLLLIALPVGVMATITYKLYRPQAFIPITPPITPPSGRCSVTLTPDTLKVKTGNTAPLTAQVITTGNSVVIEKVEFIAGSIVSLNPKYDFQFPFTTNVSGIKKGTTTATARVYIKGIVNPACLDTSTIEVY